MVNGWVDKRWKGNNLPVVWSTSFGCGNGKTKEVLIIECEKVWEIKSLFNSILCLAGEGPEVESHAKLFDAIVKESQKALTILEGE